MPDRTTPYGAFNFALNSTYVHKYEYQNSAGGDWHQNVGIYSGTDLPVHQVLLRAEVSLRSLNRRMTP